MIPGNGIETGHFNLPASHKISFISMIPGNGIETKDSYNCWKNN